MVMGEFTQETDVLVVGGGPGGYAAAFRAADLGRDVTLVDAGGKLGGVCLFRGCIPSKTLLKVAELLYDAGRAHEMGITFGRPEVDLARLRQWKNQVVERLSNGLMELARKRGVQVVRGRAHFESPHRVRLRDAEVGRIKFRHAVIATGSRARPLQGMPFTTGSRIMGSAGSLALAHLPVRLLVVGGGYVGVELGSVYAALGSRVTLVEESDGLMAGADRDLVQPLAARLEESFEAIHYRTRVAEVREDDDGVEVRFEGDPAPARRRFDRVLVAVGRIPNSDDLGLDVIGVARDESGFVMVDERRRTNVDNIYAVGDVAGGMMLAHKAMHEGKVAAEAIAGQPSAFDFQAIPSVVYTDPQIAWCGITEAESRRSSLAVKVSRFPWLASGRAVLMGLPKGLTKVIIDAETQRVLGVGIVGRDAGEMIAEGALAVEMGALAQDLALTMHPHPTLSESEAEAAEAIFGGSTHILPPKRG